MTKLRVLDLFSGIGGFSLGLERSGGFETVKFCEIEDFPRRVLAKHWPGIPIHDDVTTYDFIKGEADVITAGFPCQDISFAGAGAGLSGSRSGLYREVIRAIRLVRPLYTIMENVAALLSRGLGTVLGDLAEIGNDAEWDCIPAAAVRAPHGRDRIWIVAYPNSWRRWPNSSGRNEPNREDARRKKTDRVPRALPEQCHSWQVASSSYPDGQRRLQPGWCFEDIRQRLNDGFESPHEWSTPWPEKLSQIQGMDDGISNRLDKSGIDATGNAVVPQIPELIGRVILDSLPMTPPHSTPDGGGR